MPVQPPPLQPANVEPAAGVAVNVTTVPLGERRRAGRAAGDAAGVLVAEPLPVPAFVTVSVCGQRERRGDRLAALIVTVQVPVPEQPPPLQPVNVEPAAGVAVSVTTVPSSNDAAQVAPQVIPAGPLDTVPEPGAGLRHGQRVRDQRERRGHRLSPLIVTMHVPVPEQPAPLQPAKVEPAAGVAVSVTTVPSRTTPSRSRRS